MVSTTLRPLYSRERRDTHCTGGWLGLGAGLDGMEILVHTGIRPPDRPALSESLYRLRYPGRRCLDTFYVFHLKGSDFLPLAL